MLRQRRALVAIAVGVLLLGSVALAAVLMRKPKPPALPPPPVAAADTQSAKVIKWEIRSEPTGAVVMRKGDQKVLGQTPWTYSQDAGSGMIEVELRKQGYSPKKLQLDLGSDISLQAKLVSEKPSTPERKVPVKRGKGGRKKGSAIRDNNDVPLLR